MEAPLALYRRYRPETFAEVIGQEHVTTPLRAALNNNRVEPRLPVLRPARLRQDHQRPDPGPLPQLRAGADRQPVRRLPVLHRPGPRRPGLHRRHRDRRGQPRRRGRRPRPARAGLLRAGEQPLQGLHHRRGAHGHPAGLQRPAQARRGAARAPQVRVRDHRARQGDRHDPVADPPLPVPADPAAHAVGLPARAVRQGGRRGRRRPPCRWWSGPAAAPPATPSPCSTS